jgi:tetratricopeptide (TPR) repeat protein
VYRETEGNPFLMTQLVRLRLLQGEPAETAPIGRALGREEGVRRVVLSRLSRLSVPCREALDVASIIGRDFTGPVLAGAAGLAPQSLLERLAEAIDTRILLTREHAPEGYRFVHSIFQEVLQAELSPQRRAHLHARVGAVLERLYGDELETHAADLAHHFSEAVPAGFVPQAVDYCLQAGRMAVSQCAWEEACSQMQRAADLLELLPARAAQRDRVFAGEVWEKLGDAYYFAADIDRAFEAYEQASRRVPLEENVWRARLKDDMANLHTLRHRFDQALACLAEADALLGSPAESADDSWWDTWLVVQQHRGMVHFTEGRLEELRRLVDQVGKTAGTHGGARERAHFQRLQMMAAWTHSRFVSTSDTMELAQDCAKNYRAAGSPEDLLYAERILVQAYTWSPDQWGEAYDQLVRFLELARRNHSIWHEFPALWHMQMWHRRRGEVDAVRDYSLATLSLTAQHRGAWKEFGGEAKGHLSWVALRTGDLDQARILSFEALREIRGDSYSPFEWQARWTLLGLALHDRDWPEAVRQAEAMLDPSQHKMPDDLEESLRALIQVQAQGDKPVEALAASARAHGYL